MDRREFMSAGIPFAPMSSSEGGAQSSTAPREEAVCREANLHCSQTMRSSGMKRSVHLVHRPMEQANFSEVRISV